MFNISVKVGEKDLGPIIKFFNTKVQVQDLDIQYIPRVMTTTTKKHRAKPAYLSGRLAKSEQLVLDFFKKQPNILVHKDAVGELLLDNGYSRTSDSPILSALIKIDLVTKVSRGVYRYVDGLAPKDEDIAKSLPTL